MSVSIPSALANPDFRFVKLRGADEKWNNGHAEYWKIPIEKDWTSNSNYCYNDESLLKWIDDGGNYGVLGGFGNLVIIDEDMSLLGEYMKALSFPQTFTVSTPNGGKHYYYRVKAEHMKKIRVVPLINKDRLNLGELRGEGGQVVGPNCITGDGRWYSVINDAPISELNDKMLLKLLNLVRTGQKEINIPEPRITDESEKITPAEAANEVLFEFDFGIITHRFTEQMYRFNGQYYEPIPDNIITDYLYQRHPKKRMSFITETLARVKAETHHDPEEFDGDPNKIALENGVLNIETGVLEPFNLEEIHTIVVPVKYDKNAQCEKWKRFISEVVSPEDALILQEFAGYCLYRGYIIKKWLMLIGGGDNGKTVFSNVLISLLGKENVSNFSLLDIAENRFARADLLNKLANINSDISKVSLRDSSQIKILTGGDTQIQAEKKFKDPFTFTNTAKFIFACNNPPIIYDESDAFYERMVVVTFPNTFKIGVNAIPNLDRILIEEEAPGIFNWCYEGLKRLLEKKSLSVHRTAEETRDLYQKLSNPVLSFITNRCVIDATAEISKSELYRVFLEYCKEKKLFSFPKITFAKVLQQAVPNVDEFIKHDDITRKNVRYWSGIRVRTEDDNSEANRGVVALEKFDEEEGEGFGA